MTVMTTLDISKNWQEWLKVLFSIKGEKIGMNMV